MAKVKGVLKAAKAIGKTRAGKGAGIAAGAKVAEEATDNPFAQAGLGAVEGAALGSALGPWGAVGGAVAGGLLGFVLADGERVVPVDMIAIPAYQYSAMLQGREPTFQLYIKEGEIIMPIQPTDSQVSGALLVSQTMPKKKLEVRKLNGWQKYIKKKSNHIKFKSGKNRGKLNLKAMSKAYKRSKKGGKK